MLASVSLVVGLVVGSLLTGLIFWQHLRDKQDAWTAQWRVAKQQLADAGIQILPVRGRDGTTKEHRRPVRWSMRWLRSGK